MGTTWKKGSRRHGCHIRMPIKLNADQASGSPARGLALSSLLPLTMPLLASFWIAQADALYAVVSTTLLLVIVLLVLRPGNR